MSKRIVIVNGPNLNMLGQREPSIYGTESMEQIMLCLQRHYPDVRFTYLQSNHEGDLIDWVQEYAMHNAQCTMHNEMLCDGIVLNAGGYTHTSVALRDAVAMAQVPVVEVHISYIRQREPFRRVSLLTDVCAHTIMGIGTRCYEEAVAWIIKETEQKER